MDESYTEPGSASRAWKSIRAINFRSANGSAAARAYCDLRLETDVGGVTVHGFAVVEKDGKAPWVAFPQKPGKTRGKWFPVFEADGKLRQLIAAAVLDAYSAMGKQH